MSFKMGLDLGYGYVKAVNEKKQRIVFPSLVCDAYERSLAGIFDNSKDRISENMHLVLTDNGNEKEYFVGDLARREGKNLSIAFDEDKINHPNTKAMLAASSLLLLPKEHVSVHLVTGLPLEQYTHKKEEFRNMLKSFRVTAYFKGVDLKKVISFDKVTIFPQAAGAVYSSIMDNLTSYLIQGSYLGLIDIGFRTTDIISFMVEDTLILREDLSFTLDFGMSNLNGAADKLFTKKTGSKLDLPELMRMVSTGKIFYKGEEWNFTNELNACKSELARVIKDRVKSVWGNKLNFYNTVFLAGGGAKELYENLKDIHSHTVLTKDARFANANGFLKVAELEAIKSERRGIA
jgi:plasmid segregation protein ParM